MNRASTGLLRVAGRALLARLPSSTVVVQPSFVMHGLRGAAPLSAAVQNLWQQPWTASLLQQQLAGFASQASGSASAAGTADDKEATAEASASEGANEGAPEDEEDQPTVEHLTAELRAREKAVEELQGKVNELADSFKRSLAEMENLRQRTQRQVENAHKFAVEPIIKPLLDVADNLQRAAEAVPAGFVEGSEVLDAERATKLLRSLLQGVQMTEGVLMKVFKKHAVEQYNPAGEKFDPNLHQAMFEVPDPTKEAGTVAVVTKRGYKMHDRILRAAEVGVYKAP